ncbi:hypothetical protein AYO21_04020 [Fonsecaea monophora]|uniref:Zn(2)-C6 fungal-type domain-containing protein n=1 Tax=Fonsecaea monophora TaxID=254056 RepID=A0A177FC20_9EURO|nr:hypothetical protein AYO21_04020 [Fonsecaea monophora]KAH0847814.1 putative C6 transcription factor (Ctf1B) [Fonsecaea pedrosoi]OAG41785.1 hypothetical protein AYO21_04020 [Fonsecaea monophora]
MSSPSAEREHQRHEINKRKANEVPPDAGGKRRAARACLSCRSRKVRCDVLRDGPPCTNCRLDNVMCLLRESTRTRVRPSSETVETTTRVNGTDADADADVDADANADFPVALTFEGSRGAQTAIQASSPAGNRANSRRSSTTSPVATSTGPTHLSADHQAQGLPSYIRPLSRLLSPEDLEYLTKKGALTLPDRQLQRELLRKYIQYVYPFMPALELSAFISPIVRGDGNGSVSLLLFQAVMFVSVTFVDLEYLQARGYQSRRSARKIFFERVRLLYDFDCETDRTTILQAVLLMTYWYETPEDEKDTWYWTGIALSQAQVLSMHRNPDYLDVGPAVKRLRKRIWWSCFIRDRLMALGMRRPTRIRTGDFNVPILTLDDFETDPFKDDVLRYLGRLPMTEDIVAKKRISMACIELTKLCIHIGNILFTQYSILGNPTGASEENMTMMVMPRKSTEQINDMIKCDFNLQDWLQNLDPTCRYEKGCPSVEEGKGTLCDEGRRVLNFHLAMIHMAYLTATAILHRPWVLRSNASAGADNRMNVLLSGNKVTDAAIGITEIVYDLCSSGQIRYASTTTIPVLVSAILIHLIDIRSCREEARYTSIGRFYQCWQALQHLREMYASADYAVRFLETVIRKANVHIPMFKIDPLPASPRLPPPQSGESHFPTRLTSNSVDPPGIEPVGQLVTTDNLHSTFQNFRGTPTDTTNTGVSGSTMLNNNRQGFGTTLPSRTEASSFLDSDLPNTINVDPQGNMWTEYDADADLLQALVQFDADSTIFTSGTGV